MPRSPVLWALFGFSGRVSRRVYWLTYFLFLAITSVLVAQVTGAELASFAGLAETLLPVAVLVTLYSNIAVSVKRLHDCGYSGFLAAALLIPLVNLAFSIWIGIIPGTAGPNAYGEAPDVLPA